MPKSAHHRVLPACAGYSTGAFPPPGPGAMASSHSTDAPPSQHPAADHEALPLGLMETPVLCFKDGLVFSSGFLKGEAQRTQALSILIS